jgi:hypothetical protein
MGRPSRGEQVKLPVQILMVASDCHASLVGFGASGKARLILRRAGRAPTPGENAKLHPHFSTDKVSFLGKEVLFHDLEHLGKELDLLVGGRTAPSLDAGEDFAGHVDVSDQM